MPAFAGMTAEAWAMGHSFRRLVLRLCRLRNFAKPPVEIQRMADGI
jgi:hypothetical protein